MTDFNAFREIWNLNERSLHELILKILSADKVIIEQELNHPQRKISDDVLKRWIIESDSFSDLTKTPQLPDPNPKPKEKLQTVLHEKSLSEPLERLRKLLVDEVGFLVDERINALVGDNPTVKLDSLFEELGITRQEDVDLLLQYFISEEDLDQITIVEPNQVFE